MKVEFYLKVIDKYLVLLFIEVISLVKFKDVI